MYLGLVRADGKIEERIWRPFSPERGNQEHLIRLSVPDQFVDSKRSILMIPRVVLFTLQAGISTGRPAVIDPEHLVIMREAVAKHGADLTAAERQSAERRLKTCLYRAGVLEKVTKVLLLVDIVFLKKTDFLV